MIGIFTAMEKEAKSFLQNSTCEKIGMFDIYHITVGGKEAVLCCPPSIGEITAAAACQMMISHFNVECILNFGVVGALTAKSAVESTMYVGSVVHYDMDTSQIDNSPIGHYDCFGGIVNSCDSNLLTKATQIKNLPIVCCASADKFVADSNSKAKLNRDFGAEICDMESAGILWTCKFNNIPCLLVKCVSDSLFGGSGEFVKNAEKAAANFMSFANMLCEKL